MPRDEGFAVADIDTGKHNDAKFKRLWRILHDEAAMNAAVALYEAVQLESWAEGDRVPAEDAAPFWMADLAGSLAALREADLLDDEYRLPVKAWESWFGPAYERREQRRIAGGIGGRSSGRKRSGGEATVEQPLTTAEPVRTVPSVPTVPSDRESRARSNGLEPIGVIIPDAMTPDPDVARLQKLAEELTQQPYVMANVHSGFGKKAVEEQLARHRFDAVERAWRQIANRAKAEGRSFPTLKQLVLGADDILNPVPRADSKELRQDEERAAFDRRVARTQAEIASLRALD